MSELEQIRERVKTDTHTIADVPRLLRIVDQPQETLDERGGCEAVPISPEVAERVNAIIRDRK